MSKNNISNEKSLLLFNFVSNDKLNLTLFDFEALDKFINITKLEDKITLELFNFINELLLYFIKLNKLTIKLHVITNKKFYQSNSAKLNVFKKSNSKNSNKIIEVSNTKGLRSSYKQLFKKKLNMDYNEINDYNDGKDGKDINNDTINSILKARELFKYYIDSLNNNNIEIKLTKEIYIDFLNINPHYYDLLDITYVKFNNIVKAKEQKKQNGIKQNKQISRTNQIFRANQINQTNHTNKTNHSPKLYQSKYKANFRHTISLDNYSHNTNYKTFNKSNTTNKFNNYSPLNKSETNTENKSVLTTDNKNKSTNSNTNDINDLSGFSKLTYITERSVVIKNKEKFLGVLRSVSKDISDVSKDDNKVEYDENNINKKSHIHNINNTKDSNLIFIYKKKNINGVNNNQFSSTVKNNKTNGFSIKKNFEQKVGTIKYKYGVDNDDINKSIKDIDKDIDKLKTRLNKEIELQEVELNINTTDLSEHKDKDNEKNKDKGNINKVTNKVKEYAKNITSKDEINALDINTNKLTETVNLVETVETDTNILKDDNTKEIRIKVKNKKKTENCKCACILF